MHVQQDLPRNKTKIERYQAFALTAMLIHTLEPASIPIKQTDLQLCRVTSSPSRNRTEHVLAL